MAGTGLDQALETQAQKVPTCAIPLIFKEGKLILPLTFNDATEANGTLRLGIASAITLVLGGPSKVWIHMLPQSTVDHRDAWKIIIRELRTFREDYFRASPGEDPRYIAILKLS